MILVAGATGYVGGEVCRRLAAAGKPVRALVRPTADQGRITPLRQAGVETVAGDLKDRRSLDAACRGVRAIVSTAAAITSRQPGDSFQTVDLDGQRSLIDAARAAGVAHFVFVSVSGRFPTDDNPLISAKRQVEDYLERSGMTYTIFRPTNFMEVWLSPMLGFDPMNGRARIYGTGRNKRSWISLGDVAEFAVRALNIPAARNATIELGGPEALSYLDVVRIFEDVTGRSIEVDHIPEEALRMQRDAATNPLDKTFAALMLATAGSEEIDMRRTLADFPIRLATVRDYAKRLAASPAPVPAPQHM